MHILNNCEAFLEYRYLWRHNSVVTFLVETLKADKPDQLDIYADIEGHRINGLTIPSNIVVTNQKPDIVIIDRSQPITTVWLFELTVSFEQNIEQAHTRKKVRYSYLESDIEANGFKCVNIPFEIGSRGHITMANKTSLATVHKITKSKMKFNTYLQTISKISLLCSYNIYNARNDRGWGDPPPLRPYKVSV